MKTTKDQKLKAIKEYFATTGIYDVHDITRLHRGYFFSPETMRFFRSCLLSEVFPTNKEKVVFVTSESTGFDHSAREFNIRVYDLKTDDMTTVSKETTRARP